MNAKSEYSLLQGWQLVAARVFWWGILFLTLGVWLGAYLNDFSVYLSQKLTPVELDLLLNIGFSRKGVVLYIHSLKALNMAVYTLVATLIYLRRSSEWHTILISVTLILIGSVSSWVFPSLSASQLALYHLGFLIQALGWTSLGILFCVFPDGRLVPKWTGWVVIISALYIFTSLLIGASTFQAPTSNLGDQLVLFVFFGVGIFAQTYRYFKVSSQTQRQQTKWVVYAFMVSIPLLFFIDLIPLIVTDLRDPNTSLGAFYELFLYDLQYRIVYLLLPLAMGMAILQYNLFNIDVIIRRTLVYGILTGLLILIYGGNVVVLQSLMTALTGQVSSISIVISTLAIAALFSPLRTRVQDFIDRRFYRSKYDAERALVSFSQITRDEVDMQVLAQALSSTISESLQPERLDVWINADNPSTTAIVQKAD